MNTNRFFPLLLFVFIVFQSCSGQTSEDCKTQLSNARKNLNMFYQNSDTGLLMAAIKDVQKALSCSETKSQAVELKTSLLILLGSYREAYEFIESLQVSDFPKAYKKEMNFNFLKGLESESYKDSVGAKKHFHIASTLVRNYIDSLISKDGFDKDAYYDYFLIRSKVLSNRDLNKEIELYIIKDSINKDFFESLKSSFNTSDNTPVD